MSVLAYAMSIAAMFASLIGPSALARGSGRRGLLVRRRLRGVDAPASTDHPRVLAFSTSIGRTFVRKPADQRDSIPNVVAPIRTLRPAPPPTPRSMRLDCAPFASSQSLLLSNPPPRNSSVHLSLTTRL